MLFVSYISIKLGVKRKFEISWTKIKYKLEIIPLPTISLSRGKHLYSLFVYFRLFFSPCICFIWPYTFTELALFLHK